MFTMLRSIRAAVLCLGLGLGGLAAAAEPVVVLPVIEGAPVDAELWPGAPVLAHRTEKTVEVRRRGDGTVVADDLAGIEVYPAFAMVYRKVAEAGADDDDTVLSGVIARDGQMVFPIEKHFIAYFEVCDCFLVVRDKRVQMTDLRGQLRTDLWFDDVHVRRQTTERLWPVVRDQKYGVLDVRTAQLVVPMQYQHTKVQGDVILARDDEDRWHVFDTQGVPLPGLAAADEVEYWPEARALIVDDAKIVALDGKVLVPAGRYTAIKPAGKHAIVEHKRMRGLIDLTFKEVLAPRYTALVPFDEYEDTDRFVIGLEGFQGERYGMVDGNGRILVQPVFGDIDRYAASYAVDPDPKGESSVRHRYLKVSRDQGTGVYALDGKELLKPIYDAIHTHDSDAPWMLVIQKHRHGLYNVALRKFTIPLGRFDDLLPFEEIGQGDELYRFQRNGRYGVVDRYGRVIVPADNEVLMVSDSMTPVLAGARRGKLDGIALERDAKGVWRALPERRPVFTEQGYDGHLIAALVKARIDARFLPEGYETPEQITAAFADGRLIEANAPSIQVSGDTAYVGFGNFKARMRGGLLPNTMPMCFDDGGFRLLTNAPVDGRRADGSRACDDAREPALHFKGDLDGRLECAECERYGVPKVWKRQADAVACTLAPWQADTAAARWREWQTAMQSTWKDLPALSEHMSSREVQAMIAAALEQVVEPESRAANALAALWDGKPSWAQPAAQARQVDADRLAQTMLDLLWRAQPAGDGGRYPETRSDLPQCARVWYLKLDEVEAAVRAHDGDPTLAWAGRYALPGAGEFMRDTYPFVTMTETEQGLRLAGISREFIDLVAWYLSVQPAAKP